MRKTATKLPKRLTNEPAQRIQTGPGSDRIPARSVGRSSAIALLNQLALGSR